MPRAARKPVFQITLDNSRFGFSASDGEANKTHDSRNDEDGGGDGGDEGNSESSDEDNGNDNGGNGYDDEGNGSYDDIDMYGEESNKVRRPDLGK